MQLTQQTEVQPTIHSNRGQNMVYVMFLCKVHFREILRLIKKKYVCVKALDEQDSKD